MSTLSSICIRRLLCRSISWAVARRAPWVGAAAVNGTNCVILAHHGCSVPGDRVDMAHCRAVHLGQAARLTYWVVPLRGPGGPRGSRRREVPENPSEFLYSDQYSV